MTRNQIIENLFTGKNFCDCIAKMEPRHLQDDLKMEVITIVCGWPEEKIIQLHENKALEFYVVRVILNQVKSKTSDFVRKYRQPVEYYVEAQPDLVGKGNNTTERHALNIYQRVSNKQQTNESSDERRIREQVEELALSEIDKLYWYDAEMIRLYLKLGSFRAIQEHTGIPFISCYKNIQKSLATLKKKAIEKAEPLFSKEELQFIQNNKP